MHYAQQKKILSNDSQDDVSRHMQSIENNIITYLLTTNKSSSTCSYIKGPPIRLMLFRHKRRGRNVLLAWVASFITSLSRCVMWADRDGNVWWKTAADRRCHRTSSLWCWVNTGSLLCRRGCCRQQSSCEPTEWRTCHTGWYELLAGWHDSTANPTNTNSDALTLWRVDWHPSTT